MSETIKTGEALMRLVKSIGPFLISQSHKSRDKYLSMKHSEAKDAASLGLIKSEGESLIKMKEQCFTAYTQTTDPLEQFRLSELGQNIERELRLIQTVKLATEKITNKSINVIEDHISKNDEPETETSPSWFDVFTQFAKRPNESWREQLLANALALESLKPGSISLKTIWTLGMLDYQVFELFAMFCNICTTIDGYPMFCDNSEEDETILVPKLNGEEDLDFVSIFTWLQENSMVSHVDLSIPTINTAVISYEEQAAILDSDRDYIHTKAYCLTDTGYELFCLYEPIPNATGLEFYYRFVAQLSENSGLEIKPQDDNE